jgi:hypothetical protein
MASHGDMHVSDADRDAAATRLREHFAAGTLTLEEFQDRLAAAFAATTGRELGRVTADLPHDGISPRIGIRVSAGGRRPRPGQPQRRPFGRPRLRLRSWLLLACAAITAFWLLIGYSLLHGGLLVAAFLLMLGLAGLTVGVVASLIWLGRRAWRRGAWLEALPVLVGMPWLGRAIWAGRAVWMGRAAWRASARFRPAYPAGHDRTAARSGTTR